MRKGCATKVGVMGEVLHECYKVEGWRRSGFRFLPYWLRCWKGINLAVESFSDTFGHTRTTNTPSHLEPGSQVSSGALSTEVRDDSGIARAECFFFIFRLKQ